jgi:hypothetical protein
MIEKVRSTAMRRSLLELAESGALITAQPRKSRDARGAETRGTSGFIALSCREAVRTLVNTAARCG